MSRFLPLRPGSAWFTRAMLALALLVGTAGLTGARANPVNLVQNGDFSSTTLTGAGGYLCGTNSNTCTSTVSNWASTCASAGNCDTHATPSSLLIAGSNGSAWNGGFGLWGTVPDAPLGGNTVAIDGDPQYSTPLSQTISGLMSGDHYQLTFYQAAAQQKGLTGATTERWQVSLGNVPAQYSATQYNASQGVVGWSLVTLDFTATSASELLSFLAQGTPNGEPPVVLLSDVSLVDVPEPAAAGLLALGLVTMAFVRRRRA